MEKRLIAFMILALTISLTVEGQNLFFIGKKHYPCTKIFTLQSNSEYEYGKDIKALIAKDRDKGLFVVSIESPVGEFITGKIIIYLDNGTVISCQDNGIYDFVDKIAITVYHLTNEDLNKMEKSNINKIRYFLKCDRYLNSEGNYTVSNTNDISSKRTNVPNLISVLMKNKSDSIKDQHINITYVIQESINSNKIEDHKKSINNNISNAFGKRHGTGNQGYVIGDPNSKSRSGSYLGSTGNGYQLSGRSLVGSLPKPKFNSLEEGIVVVKIKIDRNGYVVGAEYSLKGSTTQNSKLINASIKAAKRAKFNRDPNSPAFVYGTITYHFELD